MPFAVDPMVAINNFRNCKKLCDVTLQAENSTFPCHRVILAALVPYFDVMFSDHFVESQMNHILLRSVNAEGLRICLEYVYTGTLSVNEENIKDVLTVASFLGITNLVEECAKYVISNIDLGNALDYYLYAVREEITTLKHFAYRFIQDRFETIAATQQFLAVPFHIFIKFISCRHTFVDKEEFMFQLAMDWIHYDLPDREQCFKQIIGQIRWNFINSDTVVTVTPDQPGLKCSEYLELVNENRPSFRPRRPNRSIYVFGCHMLDDRSWRSVVYRYDGMYTQKATYMNQNQLRYDYAQVVNFKSDIYMLSYVATAKTNHFCRFNFADKRWTTLNLPSKPLFVYNMVTMESMNSLYINLATWITPSLAHEDYNVHCYAADIGKWFRVAAQGCDVRSSGLAAYNNVIYSCGGYSRSGGAQCKVLMLDPRVGKWHSLRPMLRKSYCTSAVFMDDKLYSAGGRNSEGNTNLVQKYDLVADRWQYVSTMVNPNDYLNLLRYGNKLWAINSIVEVYDPVDDTWTFKKYMQFNEKPGAVACVY